MNSPGTPVVLSGELPEFTDINDDLWQDAVAASVLIRCRAGARLPGDRSTAGAFMVVLQGRIKVFQTSESGREIGLYHVRGGNVCAHTLMPLLGYPIRGAQAVAEEDSRILSVPFEYFNHLLAGSDGFRRYALSAMARCITDITQLIAQVSFMPLDIRLARFLQSRSCQTTAGPLRMTHQAIADEIGTTREVVSRLLKAFEKSGYIRLGRSKIEIISLGELCRPCKSA